MNSREHNKQIDEAEKRWQTYSDQMPQTHK